MLLILILYIIYNYYFNVDSSHLINIKKTVKIYVFLSLIEIHALSQWLQARNSLVKPGVRKLVCTYNTSVSLCALSNIK